MCMDGFYISSPMFKLSHIGAIILLAVCLTHVRSTFHLQNLIIVLCLLGLGLIGSLLSNSPRNQLYFLSQCGLLVSCVLVFWASSNQKLTPLMLKSVAMILILGSFGNYFILLLSGVDILLELGRIIGIESSTSRNSLETAFGRRMPRMYFLSSEPSTHAITVVCLYVALMQNSNLNKFWKFGFFANVLCTFSLSGILLFLLYNICSHRHTPNNGLFGGLIVGGLIAMFLLFGSFEFSTLNKMVNILDSPRVEQFFFASAHIDIKPTDISLIPDVGTSVFSLWLYILIANGVILSALMLLPLLFLGDIARINRVLFFLIFIVTPIGYFNAASFLAIKKR